MIAGRIRVAAAGDIHFGERDNDRERAAAAFGAYLRELALVTPPVTVTIHQGDDMGRPGVLTVELRAGDARVRVSGAGTTIPA